MDVAHNGVDGLWRARETRYDAIILDLMMPGMSGWKVCEALRSEGNWTPVLMLTAKDGEWDQVEALDTGADDYVTKPFSFAILVARLRALIRRGAIERPVILEAGDLRLDPATRRVWRDGAEVSLTAREFAVLEHLLRHRGQVLSKRDVIAGRVGRRLRGRSEHRRGVCRPSAPEARPALRSHGDRDRAGRRLPVGR